MTNKKQEVLYQSSPTDGELNVSLEMETDEDTLELIEQALSLVFFFAFKKDLGQNLESYITFANFFGEADDYIAEHPEIIIEPGKEKEIRKQIAMAMFTEFSGSYDSLIEYDEQENVILLSPYIADLEYGSYYRPALGIITKAWETFVADLQKKIDDGFEPPAGSSESSSQEQEFNDMQRKVIKTNEKK